MSYQRTAKEAAQGRCPQTRRAREERPAHHVPAKSDHALLQAIHGKRALLRPKEKELIRTFLDRLQRRALTEKELQYAIKIGASVGVGYDDPKLDVVDESAQPWGPLPLRPPGR